MLRPSIFRRQIPRFFSIEITEVFVLMVYSKNCFIAFMHSPRNSGQSPWLAWVTRIPRNELTIEFSGLLLCASQRPIWRVNSENSSLNEQSLTAIIKILGKTNSNHSTYSELSPLVFYFSEHFPMKTIINECSSSQEIFWMFESELSAANSETRRSNTPKSKSILFVISGIVSFIISPVWKIEKSSFDDFLDIK